jgi:hypothetical protein
MRKTYLIVALLLITLRSHAQQMPLDDYTNQVRHGVNGNPRAL